MTIYGYSLQQTVPGGYNSYSFYHAKCYIFVKDGDTWREIATVSFQSDNTLDHFYGFDIKQSGNNGYFGFNEFLKFAKRVQKQNIYNSSIADFAQWLIDSKFRQLVYDNRINETATVAYYEKTKEMTPYGIYRNNSLYEIVLARDEFSAEKIILKKWAEEGQTSYLKSWDIVRISPVYPRNETNYMTIQEWMTA